ncbi:MAG TPA: GNAT family N-acetyltransferase, partial [Alphaproteobacteria bacterium]|nr:GNAT family N-acetyltransferase [Alphaproteobacteria bacterium]
LRLSGLKTHPEAFGASYEEEVDLPRERWERWLDDAHVFGGFAEAVLAGCASLSARRPRKLSHIAELGAFYVTPESRGSGLASALMDACLRAAKSRYLQIVLTVNSENAAAQKLYLRHGFTVYGRLSRSLRVDNDLYDEVFMAHEVLRNGN